jgi:hypothetical protein
MKMDEKIKYVIEHTEILKQPKKLLSTFNSTTVHYYILTEPMYLEFEGKSPESETVVREGRITWEKPKLLTPSYMLRVEGFSEEARKAFEILATENSDLALILYRLKFKRDSEKMEIVSNSLISVAKKLSSEIDERKDPFSAVIKGIDEFWDVSLSKFVHEIITRSARDSQMPDYSRRSIIGVNNEGFPVISKDSSGIPVMARIEIENLFKLFEKGEVEPSMLKKELDRWGLFEAYQDRFLSFFKKR